MKLELFILLGVLAFISSATLSKVRVRVSPRIVGGDNTTAGRIPFQCSIQNFMGHYCGCAILSDQWILTAAHCLDSTPGSLTVVVGTNDLKSGGASYTPQLLIKHEEFNNPLEANDIGLMKMKKIEFNENVQPITLSRKFIEGGQVVQASGWGRLETGGRLPNILQVINLNTISKPMCEKLNGTSIHDSHLCTFNKVGEGICNGDSGGPLVLGNELVGIANFAQPCAKGFPDGFARISYFYEWIQAQMKTSWHH